MKHEVVELLKRLNDHSAPLRRNATQVADAWGISPLIVSVTADGKHYVNPITEERVPVSELRELLHG